jgi:biotin transport system ATP-binding protein
MMMDRPQFPHTPATATSLSLANVGYIVDGKEILVNVTVQSVSPRVGIVGRNGSGKSTLARLIAGLIAPTTGTIEVNGQNLAKDRKAALAEIGILFQNPDHQIIFPTVEEEISFGLRQLGNSKETAKEKTQDTLAAFSKSHWADAHISTLSQGQKHLVCLMSVVAMKPKAIILDEPFTGLDIPTKAQLNTYLAQYNGTVFHISHDPNDLKTYDHILWIEGGNIVLSGVAVDVLAAYTTKMNQLGGLDDISDLTR